MISEHNRLFATPDHNHAHQMCGRLRFSLALSASPIGLLASTLPAEGRDQTAPLDFQGRYLVSVSDADMVASAYVDGQLGPPEEEDVLSIISLAGDPRDWSAVEIPVSNSVAGPPASVDVTPDGRFAFVVETWTQRPEGQEDATFADLAFGERLAVVDLTDAT